VVALEPEWLDEQERSTWLRFVMLLELMPGVLDSQLRRDAGLSHFDYLVLAMLSEAPDRMLRMTALATLTNATLPRLSHVVSRLEERGYVERQPCPQDRRATNAILTEPGWQKVVEIAPLHVEHVREHVVDALTETQLVQLREICDAMLQRIPAARQMTAMREAAIGD
jgi:DNA-binding MarR family transcriptional regulator